MEHFSQIMIYGGIISLISILAVLSLSLHKKIRAFMSNNLLLLTTFSAGIFLVTSILLARETIEILSLSNALMSFGIGALLFILIHFFFKSHRHLGKKHVHQKHSAWKVLFGDTLHNIADGLFLVASFSTGTFVGNTTALSIILHEVPQEISEFFVLRKSGYSIRQAVSRNFITALSIFIGIGIALFVMNTNILQAWLLGITSVFFLGVVFTDLFPVRQLYVDKKIGKLFVPFLLGVILMTGISFAMGHSHAHEDHHGHYYDEHHLHHHDEEHIHEHHHEHH